MHWLRSIYIPTLFTLSMLLLSTFSLLFLIPTVIGIFDVVARYKDYKYLRSLSAPQWYRLSRRYKRSACQRNAFIAAAHSRGVNTMDMFPEYFWWHIFPDGTFTLKCPYLRPQFYYNLARGAV